MNITKEKKLSSLVLENYKLLPILYRFGIKLGFGDKSIDRVCIENNINPDFFIEIIKVFVQKEYAPDTEFMKILIPETIEYLLVSHKYYNEKKIPIIEKLIEKLEWKKENNNLNSNTLNKFFDQYKKEVKEHTLNEEKTVYPYVLKIFNNYNDQKQIQELKKHIKKYSISLYADKHEEMNAALLDLKNIIIKYLPPPENTELIEQILDEIFELEKDMSDHTKIEDTILVPIISKIEKQILNYA